MTFSKSSILSWTISMLFVFGISGIMFYLFEYSPAKSWNVKSLAKCTLNLKDKTKSAEILSQVSDSPRTGEINRLNSKCTDILESEKQMEAKALINEAKALINN